MFLDVIYNIQQKKNLKKYTERYLLKSQNVQKVDGKIMKYL